MVEHSLGLSFRISAFRLWSVFDILALWCWIESSLTLCKNKKAHYHILTGTLYRTFPINQTSHFTMCWDFKGKSRKVTNSWLKSQCWGTVPAGQNKIILVKKQKETKCCLWTDFPWTNLPFLWHCNLLFQLWRKNPRFRRSSNPVFWNIQFEPLLSKKKGKHIRQTLDSCKERGESDWRQ